MSALKLLYNYENNHDNHLKQQVTILSDKVNYKKKIRNELSKKIKYGEEMIEREHAQIDKCIKKLNAKHKFNELKALLNYKNQQCEYYRNEYIEKVRKLEHLNESVKKARFRQRQKSALKSQIRSASKQNNKKQIQDINLIEKWIKEIGHEISREKVNYNLFSNYDTRENFHCRFPKINTQNTLSANRQQEKKNHNYIDNLFYNRSISSKPITGRLRSTRYSATTQNDDDNTFNQKNRNKSEDIPHDKYDESYYTEAKPKNVPNLRTSKSTSREVDLNFLKGYDNSNAGLMSHLIKKKINETGRSKDQNDKNYIEIDGKMITINNSDMGINEEDHGIT